MVNAPPGFGHDFFRWLKDTTEADWASGASFDFPHNTRWRPGLDPAQIAAYEAACGYAFPASYRTMLAVMNGTHSPPGEDVLRAPNVVNHVSHFYGFPDDLAAMRERITWACEGYDLRPDELAARGIQPLHPLFSHRYLVIDGGDDPMVLSVHDRDTIIYGRTLRGYLLNELFRVVDSAPAGEPCGVFWLDEAVYPPPAPPELLALLEEKLRPN
jgi:hypothetical protein